MLGWTIAYEVARFVANLANVSLWWFGTIWAVVNEVL